jgi:hypothetical protein
VNRRLRTKIFLIASIAVWLSPKLNSAPYISESQRLLQDVHKKLFQPAF